jgi:hypothetical protein
LPAIDDALRRGELSYAKVRALTRVANPENDRRLLEIALASTGAQLERICRKFRRVVVEQILNEGERLDDRRYVQDITLPSGLVRIEAVLHPDEAALVMKAIEAARAAATTVTAAAAPPVTVANAATAPVAGAGASVAPAPVGASAETRRVRLITSRPDALV